MEAARMPVYSGYCLPRLPVAARRATGITSAALLFPMFQP